MNPVSAVGAVPGSRSPWRPRVHETASPSRFGERGGYYGEGGEGHVSEGEVDLNIHQIEGTYKSVEEFDAAWDRDSKKNILVNFVSVSLVDGRRLVNALLEEIKG